MKHEIYKNALFNKEYISKAKALIQEFKRLI